MALFTSRRRILAEKRSVGGKDGVNLKKTREEFGEKKRCVYIKQDEIREIRDVFELNKRCVWRK